MPIRRDKKGRWFFRTVVKLPDGTHDRISGTPGRPGPYHDLAQSKVGAQEAERRAIAAAMTGERVTAPTARADVPTLSEYEQTFLDNYAAEHKPSAQLAKRSILAHHLNPFFGHVRLDAIRQEDVDKLKKHLLSQKRSRKTVNNITAVLSSLLRYAVKNKVIAPIDLSFAIKTQDPEVVAVSAASVAKLAAAADAKYRAAILLAADAGLRIGEIRALSWSDVNELTREITVSRSLDRTNALSETKGWERRVVPISDRLWDALRALDKPTRHVIGRNDGQDRPLRYDGVREAVINVYKRAKVPVVPRPWHSLRHTFCTELAKAGVPVNEIRELAGHKSIETTLRYMHTDRESKRRAIDALRGSHVAAERSKKS